MNPTRILTAAALGTILSVAAPAQTAAATTARFVPAGSSFVLRVGSPAKWQQQFGTTQVAKLLHSDTLAPVMEQMTGQFEMMLDQLRQSGEFDADIVEKLLTEWRGDIVIGGTVDWETFAEAMEYGDLPDMSFSIALTPDGSYDFAALAEELTTLIEEAPRAQTMHDIVVGDVTVRASDNDDGSPDATMPQVIDGHLVMFVGTDIDKDVARMLAADNRHAGALGTGPLHMHANLAPMVTSIIDSVADMPAPFDIAGMMEMLGLGALRDLTIDLRTDQQHIVGEIHLGLSAANRGLLDVMPASNEVPRLMRSVPPNATSFSVSSMDLGVVMNTIEGMWNELDAMVDVTFDDVMEMFSDATKVRLKEDLLAHLGAEMMIVQDANAMSAIDPDELEDDPSAMMAGGVYGIALKNGKAFGESLEKAIRSRGMHVGRKSEDYANVKVHRMRIAGLFEIEYVVTNEVLLLAFGGESSQKILRNVIDARAAGDNELSDDAKAQIAAMPSGWNSIAVSPVSSMLGGIAVGLLAARSMSVDDEDVGMAMRMIQSLGKDMKQLDIDMMTSATYVDEDGLTSRIRW